MTLLSDEELDDLFYFSRANELADFQQSLDELATKHGCIKAEILEAASDADSGNSPLHYSSANGHIDIVRAIISLLPVAKSSESNRSQPSSSSLVNARNESGNTPLHWAALNGHVEVIKALLQAGADPSILNAAGHDALFEAELNEKQEAVDLLLAEGRELESGIGEGTGEAQTEGDEVDAGPTSTAGDVKGPKEDFKMSDT